VRAEDQPARLQRGNGQGYAYGYGGAYDADDTELDVMAFV